MGQCALWNGGKKQYEFHLCWPNAEGLRQQDLTINLDSDETVLQKVS